MSRARVEPPMILRIIGIAVDEMVFVVKEMDFFLPCGGNLRMFLGKVDGILLRHADFRMLSQIGIQRSGSSLLGIADNEVNNSPVRKRRAHSDSFRTTDDSIWPQRFPLAIDRVIELYC